MYDLSPQKSLRCVLPLLTCVGLAVALASGALGQDAASRTSGTPAPSLQTSVPRAESVAVLPDDYVLAPDDQLDISVEGHEEFNKTLTIPPDGALSYYGHRIEAANMTVDELTRSLTLALKRQLRYPYVTVTLRDTHPRRVSVLGAARNPGKYNYKPGMRLIDALADCGGPAQADEMTDLTLYTNNGTTSQPIDLVKLMQGTDPALNAPVQPGDVLIMQARNPATAMVLINGQVGHPGQYPVRPEGATILAMLTQAGGIVPSGRITQVQLTHDGQTRMLNLRPTEFDATAPVGQTMIAAGDTISVPLNNAKYIVWGEVRSPSVYSLADGEPTTVTKALALAGSVTPEADMKDITIARTEADGKTVYIPINEDNVVRNKKNTDVFMQDGDILIVPKRSHGNTQGSANSVLGNLFSFSALSRLLRFGF